MSSPNFVSSGYMSLSPCSGYEWFVSLICSTREEIWALRLEVSEVRKQNEKDFKALDNVGYIIQDVVEIKLLIHNLPIKDRVGTPENVIRDEIFQQLDVSSRDPMNRRENVCETFQVLPNLSISAVTQNTNVLMIRQLMTYAYMIQVNWWQFNSQQAPIKQAGRGIINQQAAQLQE